VIEEGKCYSTADGRKAGPMYPYQGFLGVWVGKLDGAVMYWHTDGRVSHYSLHQADLIGEWVEPELPPAEEEKPTKSMYDLVYGDYVKGVEKWWPTRPR
jgi:hypothetical protein